MKPRVSLTLTLCNASYPLIDASLSWIASVDHEADRNIQDTIAQEFKDRTILCIARKCCDWVVRDCIFMAVKDRLRTILSYDRICVLDSGQIVVGT
jgi:ABC-type multidrug transport system fused ATPase/permease subunit